MLEEMISIPRPSMKLELLDRVFLPITMLETRVLKNARNPTMPIAGNLMLSYVAGSEGKKC